MSFNVVFQEKTKANVMIQGKKGMSASELIHVYYKKVCASKKEKMTKKFFFNGREISPEEGTLIGELGMKDYSVVEIRTTEQMTTAPYVPPKKEEPKYEEPQQEEQPQYEEPQQEEQPQYEEQPQEEQPQEEQPQYEEQPQEEQPQYEEQPQEEQPPEEQPQEEQPQEEQLQEEQPQEEQQDDDWD